MRISRDDERLLQVEEKNTAIVLIAGITIAYALVRTGFLMNTFGLAYEYYLHWIFVAGLAGLAGKSFTEEVVFLFDRTRKEITWSRKKLFGEKKEGTLPFSAVEEVKLGFRGTGKLAKYRIEFVVEGQPFPLSKVYFQGDRSKENCMRIARRILETITPNK